MRAMKKIVVGLLLMSLAGSSARTDVVRSGSSTTTGGGGGGSGVSFPIATLSTFGTADGAANSIAFNETAGCITGEGATADTNETRVCFSDAGGFDAQLTIASNSSTKVMLQNPGGGVILNNSVANLDWTGTVLALNGTTAQIDANSGASLVNFNTSGGVDFSVTAGTSRKVYVRSTGKALTSGSAAAIVQISGLGAHKHAGGSLEFCVEVTDNTNDQMACCRSQWAAVDTTVGAGGETCTNTLDATCSAALKGAASSGTLTVTADTTTGTDLCNLRLTSTTSLTATTHQIFWILTQHGNANPTITPQ